MIRSAASPKSKRRQRIIIPFAAALLFAASLAQAAVGAEPRRAMLTISGRSGFVDLNLSSPVRFTCCTTTTAAGDIEFRGFTFRTRGAFAGYLLEDVEAARVVAGALRVPRLDLGGYQAVFRFSNRKTVPSGTYRLHLIADGWATLRIPVLGDVYDRTLNVDRFTQTRGTLASMGVRGTPVAHSQVDLEAEPSSWVLLATQLEADAGQAGVLHQCLAPQGEPCPTDEAPPARYLSVGAHRSGKLIMSSYSANPSRDRELQALFSVGTAGAIRRAHAFALVIDF